MKRRLRLFFLALTVASPLADAAIYASTPYDKTSYVEIYVGSNARWQVDRRHGVVSAWELERPLPLWSQDGVVFRLSPLANDAKSSLAPTADAPVPATEIFARVYFFLDAPSQRREHDADAPFTRRNDLLLALDPRSQGRLAWICRAQDFAVFFKPNQEPPQFVPRVESLPNDELLVVVETASEGGKRFAVDAATGTFRPLDSATLKSK